MEVVIEHRKWVGCGGLEAEREAGESLWRPLLDG